MKKILLSLYKNNNVEDSLKNICDLTDGILTEEDLNAESLVAYKVINHNAKKMIAMFSKIKKANSKEA